jgi:hypothetical protein
MEKNIRFINKQDKQNNIQDKQIGGGTLSLLEKLKFTLFDFFLQIIIKSIMVINFMSTLSNFIHFIFRLK